MNKVPWSREHRIGIVGVALAFLAILASFVVPEVRRSVRLEKATPVPVALNAPIPKSELPATAMPTPAPPKTQSAPRTAPKGRVSPSAPSSSQDCAPGANCAISNNQQGGITAGQYIGDPPPQFILTTISENTPQNGLYETEFKLQVTTARAITLHLKATGASFVGELGIEKELPPGVGGQAFMSLNSRSGPKYIQENYQDIESGNYTLTVHTAQPDKVKLEYH